MWPAFLFSRASQRKETCAPAHPRPGAPASPVQRNNAPAWEFEMTKMISFAAAFTLFALAAAATLMQAAQIVA
jgi:hypothetical protein